MTLILMADLALGFAGFYGRWRLAAGLGTHDYHFVTGLFASFLSVFAHCMSMFYFIGTGKIIREAVAEHKLDAAFDREAAGFKLRYFPIASFAITATMATPIVGGAVHAARMAANSHLAMAIITLGLNLAASAVAWRLLWRNMGLIRRVEAALPQP